MPQVTIQPLTQLSLPATAEGFQRSFSHVGGGELYIGDGPFSFNPKGIFVPNGDARLGVGEVIVGLTGAMGVFNPSATTPATVSFRDVSRTFIALSDDPTDAGKAFDAFTGIPFLPSGGGGSTGRIKSLVDFGADPTGVIDATAVINIALAAGATLATDGVYKVNGVVNIPATAAATPDFMGTGEGRVTFKLGAGGQFRFGTRAGTGGASPIGGQIGNFKIDGQGVQNVAGGAFYVGLVTEAMFTNLTVTGCAGADTVVVEGAQNCSWYDLNVVGNVGYGVALDYGAGGHTFFNPEVAYNGGNGTWNWAFRQTGASTAGVYPTSLGPSQNQIIGGRIEAPSQNALGSILHAAGTDNSIIACAIGSNWATGTTPDTNVCIRVQKSTVSLTDVLSTYLTISDCKLLGAGAAGGSGVGTGIDVTGDGGPSLSGSVIIHRGGSMGGFARPYRTTQEDRITSRDVIASSNGPARWTQKTGDTPVVREDAVMLGDDPPAVLFSALGYSAGMTDTPSLPAKYRRIGNHVQLQGSVNIGAGVAANTAIVTIPAHLRPAQQCVFAPPMINNSAYVGPTAGGYLLSLSAAGVLSVNFAGAAVVGGQVVLDGVTWLIGQ